MENNNTTTKQTKNNKPKIVKEKKPTKIKDFKVHLVEHDIKKNFDICLKGIKFSEKKCDG